jgi:hypothetical protein
MRLHIYLDADVQDYLAQRAAEKGIPLGEMVNGLLKRRCRNKRNQERAIRSVGGRSRNQA